MYNHAKNAAEQTLVEQQVLPVKEESYADLLGLTAKQEDIFKSFRERDDSAIPGASTSSRARSRSCPT